MSGSTPIKVWRFHNAPEEYKMLSPHGGDEDWLAWVPKEIDAEWILWMDGGSPFGVCSVSTHHVRDGVVKIGAHA